MPLPALRVLSLGRGLGPLLAALMASTGCTSSGRYYVTPGSWAAGEALRPHEDHGVAISAQEAGSERRVWLKVGALQRGRLLENQGCRVLIQARAPNPLLSTGVGLLLGGVVLGAAGGALLSQQSASQGGAGWAPMFGDKLLYQVYGATLLIGGVASVVAGGTLALVGRGRRTQEIQPDRPRWTYRQDQPLCPGGSARP